MLLRHPPLLRVVLIGLGITSCRGEQHPLKVSSQCKSPEVISCLQEYAYEGMRDADIERLVVQGIEQCFSKDRRLQQKQAGTCLPLRVGTDRQEHPLELVFRCEDDCTTTGHIWLKYAEATPLKECCERGGFTIRAWSFNGHYNGCGLPVYHEVFKDMGEEVEKYSLCKDDE